MMKRSIVFRLSQCALLSALAVATARPACAATLYDWNSNSSGTWSTTTKWTPNGVPSLTDDEANITIGISSNRTITLDVPATIGVLDIGNTNGTVRAYNLTGTNTLTLESASGTAAINKPDTAGGLGSYSKIDVPIQLNSNVVISQEATDYGSTLTFSKNISEGFAGMGITYNGPTAGSDVNSRAEIRGSNSYSGQTVINGPTVSGTNTVMIEAADALGSTAGNTVVNVGGILALNSRDANFTTGESIVMAGENSSLPTLPSPRIIGGATTDDAAAGQNEISGNITTSGGGSNYYIRADGGDTGSLFTLSGNIQETSASSSTLVLGGLNHPDLGTDPGHGVVSGSIIDGSGTWNVYKTDGAEWTFTGNNSYSGTTEVAQGTLFVNGNNSGTGAVTVDSGAMLAGSGSIAGTVTVAGTISPGNSPDTMTVGGLSLASGSNGLFELDNSAGNHSGSGNDLIVVNGTLTLPGGGLTIDVSAIGGGLLSAAGTWELVSYESLSGSLGAYTLTGVDTVNYNAVVSAGSGFAGDGLYLTLSPVPEPSTFVLAGLGVVGLCALRRRHRASNA